MTTQDYGLVYHSYPVNSEDNGFFEGAVHRFKTFPTPTDVYKSALRGLPKIYPLTGETIEISDMEEFLDAAVTEIEMSLGLDLTPTQHWHSADTLPEMFSANYAGIKLPRWPATQIVSVDLKFPTTQTASPYYSYHIPPEWLSLRRNVLNIIPSVGIVLPYQNNSSIGDASGAVGLLGPFGMNNYRPSAVEVQYVSGFALDRLPSTVFQLIVTLASIRALEAFIAVLFPNSSSSVTLDSATQSAVSQIAGLLMQRLDGLKEQYQQMKGAIQGGLGRNIKMAFIGS